MSYILKAEENKISKWLTINEKEVKFPYKAATEIYYSIKVADYITAIVLTSDDEVVLVRQYRPAVDDYTLELPAGLVDGGESPVDAIIREVYEETGCRSDASNVKLIGKMYSDTGRIDNEMWGYYIDGVQRDSIESWQPEEGVEPVLVTRGKFLELINDGTFNHALHLALVTLAITNGHLKFT